MKKERKIALWQVKKKKGFKLPHQLVILFCIAAIAMVAT